MSGLLFETFAANPDGYTFLGRLGKGTDNGTKQRGLLQA